MQFLTDHWVEIMALVLGLRAAAEAVVRMTKTKADDALLGKVTGVLDKLLLLGHKKA